MNQNKRYVQGSKTGWSTNINLIKSLLQEFRVETNRQCTAWGEKPGVQKSCRDQARGVPTLMSVGGSTQPAVRIRKCEFPVVPKYGGSQSQDWKAAAHSLRWEAGSVQTARVENREGPIVNDNLPGPNGYVKYRLSEPHGPEMGGRGSFSTQMWAWDGRIGGGSL